MNAPRPTCRVLSLPGWRNSDERHWQTLWEAQCGHLRVEQSDWEWPRRGDWMARLDEVISQDAAPTVLVAHSLGCQLVASWAAHSKLSTRVCAALLVAPADTEREDLPPQLFNWRPIIRQALPFASLVVASPNDPYCRWERSVELASGWGSQLMNIGDHGHINSDSGLADWPQGLLLLDGFLQSSLVSCQGSNAACSLALKPDGVVASRRHSASYDSSSRLASGLDGGAIKRHLNLDTTPESFAH